MYGLIGSDYENSVGSIFFKPFFYPLERFLDKRGEDILTVKIPVREIKASKYIPNPTGHYDKIAKLNVPEDIEESLIWKINNHHSF